MQTTPASPSTPASDNAALQAIIRAEVTRNGGWLPFDRFMQLALYAPGLGYYAHGSTKLGHLPADGSDFVTAPEISPLYGHTLAVQVAEALARTGTQEVWEFGAGSGALAEQVLDALQQQGEVLDAMPVQLLVRKGGIWHERGVMWDETEQGWAWEDRPTDLRPPLDIVGEHDYLTEIHPQAEAFIGTIGRHLLRGAAFFIDYGFGEGEYYHPQRHMGTLMCHQLHQADDNPLLAVGDKDITAHVNFTGIAVAAQDARLEILGYTTQGWFLLNCGLAERMAQSSLAERALAQKLVMEHEMGEFFKVLGVCKGEPWEAIGFARGDRMRML